MDFVDGTLHRHNSSNIEKFSLCWYEHLNESRLHSWISTVIRELKLYLHQTSHVFIPLSLFTCESLTSLELRLHHNITFPKYISIPRLKRLKLRGFEFSDECWNTEFFSNSPVLEDLILKFCKFGMDNFCISIPTLKLLKIESWNRIRDDALRDCALKIHTPSLVTFTYLANVAKEYVLSSFPSLVEAVVNFKSEKDGAEISRLLLAIAHVKCLCVSDLTLQAIYSESDLFNSSVTFHNVKMLRISDNLTTDQGLVALLAAVPNLESLVFDEFMNDEQEDSDEDNENGSEDAEDYGDDDNDSDSTNEGENNHGGEDEGDVSDVGENAYDDQDDSLALDTVTSGCLFPHLRSVCFQQFAGNRREMKWVQLILRNADDECSL